MNADKRGFKTNDLSAFTGGRSVFSVVNLLLFKTHTGKNACATSRQNIGVPD
jgi:hypothetical protein